MAVIMILLFLSVAVVSRTLSGLHSTRQGQDFSAALGDADAGVSDALFRIDQLGNAPATTFCVGANVGLHGCIGSGRSDVEYTARRVDDNTYTIFARGKVNGQLPRRTGDRNALVSVSVRDLSPRRRSRFNGNSGNYDSGAGNRTGRDRSIPAHAVLQTGARRRE